MGLLSGFTLMELLVVIAIIAMLVSILMPSLQSAKSLARLAVCQANVHRIALGNSMYMGDYDGFSVHGRENSVALGWGHGDTGYGIRSEPTALFDDDYGNCKPNVPTVAGVMGNEWEGGKQNICGLGQLMWDNYIEESAESVGCPQADFIEVTPFSGSSSTSHVGEN